MIGFALGFVVVLLISHKNVEGGSIYINLTRSMCEQYTTRREHLGYEQQTPTDTGVNNICLVGKV